MDDNDDIFTLNYAEKMRIENDDEYWYVVVEPLDECTNNITWVENKCMDVINQLTCDYDDYDDWFDKYDEDCFDDEEDDYE